MTPVYYGQQHQQAADAVAKPRPHLTFHATDPGLLAQPHAQIIPCPVVVDSNSMPALVLPQSGTF